jgi:Protein of unknown function (DUF3455)
VTSIALRGASVRSCGESLRRWPCLEGGKHETYALQWYSMIYSRSRMVARHAQVLVLLGLATLASAQSTSRPDVPEKIRAPASEKPVLVAQASGSQIYVCSSSDGKPRWTLKAPEAQLHDQSGTVIGHHYAGPTWEHKDGSKVSGKAVAQINAPDADSIPWLLVTATGHAGTGVFAAVASIQRIHTKGGQPPAASECNTSTLKAEKRSSYTADYYFYAPAP